MADDPLAFGKAPRNVRSFDDLVDDMEIDDELQAHERRNAARARTAGAIDQFERDSRNDQAQADQRQEAIDEVKSWQP